MATFGGGDGLNLLYVIISYLFQAYRNSYRDG
jgi:hypothetical protein